MAWSLRLVAWGLKLVAWSFCQYDILTQLHLVSMRHIVAAWSLELGAWSLELLSIGHIDARQYAARPGELVFTISNVLCFSIPAGSTISAFIALVSGWTCPALR